MRLTDYQPPADTGLSIIYQDEFLLIMDKPSGLLSVPGKTPEKQDCLISRVRQRFPSALIVHRLDMSTSGLIVLALNSVVQRELSILFQQRQMHKHYTAIVNGELQPPTGSINLPLILDWPNRPLHKVDLVLGKPSQTHYHSLHYDMALDATRVKLTPVTGRSHQLRVHLLSLGHPILGDELYASEEAFNKAKRLLLHASYLRFQHPVTKVLVEVASAAPF